MILQELSKQRKRLKIGSIFAPSMNAENLFNKIAKQKIFIVGDVMLDNYWIGESNRMSPEAPVPIVSLQHKESRLGGALNVAANCIAMGAETYILSVIGNDEDGKQLLSISENQGINTNFILTDPNRITTTKARIISDNKHLLRIDNEHCNKLDQAIEHKFIEKCLKAIQIEKPNVLILQDYNKGVLTPFVIKNIIAHAHEIGCIIAVDPKFENFFEYKGVHIFKPNLKEVKEALDIHDLEINQLSLSEIHSQLQEKLEHQISFITLSEHGVFVQENDEAQLFPTFKRTIVDVSGAGDTVIATAALVYSICHEKNTMAQIANLAGGLVCEEVGVVAINKEKFSEALNQMEELPF